MIRAVGHVGGRPLLLLGLSGENVARIVAGEAIAFDGLELGFDANVVIVYGRTEKAMTDDLDRRGLLGVIRASR